MENSIGARTGTWVREFAPHFYVCAYSRRFTTLCELERKGESVRLRPLAPPDLLMHYLLNMAPGFQNAAVSISNSKRFPCANELRHLATQTILNARVSSMSCRSHSM